LQFTVKELEKDLGRGDITTDWLFKKPKKVTVCIIAKEAGIFAGRQEIEFFLKTRIRVKFLKKDGARIHTGDTIAYLYGDIQEILKAERVILNLLGRMSGVATATSRIVKKIKKINPNILIAPTRKTLWGLLDKRAVVLGGGETHRLGLDNAILIKDNHLDALGRTAARLLNTAPEGRSLGRDIPKAIYSFFPLRQKVAFFEIEVETPTEAKIACAVLKKLQKTGECRIPCFVMLDNFSPPRIQKTLKILHAAHLQSCAKIEASGGINEKNILAYAKTGIDIISMGSLTHSAPMFDFTLQIAI